MLMLLCVCVYVDVEDVQITLDKNRLMKYKHVCPLCHSGRNTLRLKEILTDTNSEFVGDIKYVYFRSGFCQYVFRGFFLIIKHQVQI